MSKGPEIRNLLQISTGHLKPETLTRFSDVDCNYLPFYGSSTPHGFFVYAHDDFECMDECPPEMLPIMTKAREMGCDYILFDCDAQLHPELFEVYDGEAA